MNSKDVTQTDTANQKPHTDSRTKIPCVSSGRVVNSRVPIAESR